MTVGLHQSVAETRSVASRVILYPGAAGGLGAGTTLSLLEAGDRVIAVDKDGKKMDSLDAAAAARSLDGLTILQVDLGELEGLRRALDTVAQETGGIDVVINNAAIYPRRPAKDFSIEDHQAVQRVNVDAAIVCVQVALPHMRAQHWGLIVNVASITAYGGWPDLSPYVQSKGALTGLARAWAREFGPFGITVNAISPGAFPTDAEKIHPDPETYARYIVEHQAIKRRGRPADIAGVLRFFISDQAGFIAGRTLNVDGGWVMQ
ncbi:MAG: SDR family oxidoreductase [Hyphomicrobiales bacterium]|nr:SDR family oxidoreductase [Hyphomicrobiales bacterium]